MLESERHRFIAKLVSDRSIVSISDLVKAMPFTSEATIRRDIKSLVANSVIRRIRGGVEATASPPPNSALIPKSPAAILQKRAIARAAAELVQDGESIIVAAGSTTLALVEFLKDARLDILTNSIVLAARLMESNRNRGMLPGGALLPEQGIVLSPYDDDYLDRFSAQKMFTSCQGIRGSGLMESDPLIVRAQRRLLSRADEVIVLADSRKLRQHPPMVVAPLNRISTLITDNGADAEELRPFRRAGMRVIVTDLDQPVADGNAVSTGRRIRARAGR